MARLITRCQRLLGLLNRRHQPRTEPIPYATFAHPADPAAVLAEATDRLSQRLAAELAADLPDPLAHDSAQLYEDAGYPHVANLLRELDPHDHTRPRPA